MGMTPIQTVQNAHTWGHQSDHWPLSTVQGIMLGYNKHDAIQHQIANSPLVTPTYDPILVKNQTWEA